MITGLDLGGSFVKRIDLTNELEIIEKSLLPTMDFTNFLNETDISEIDGFIVTGGKSNQISGQSFQQDLTKIHEFEAMRYFLREKDIHHLNCIYNILNAEIN